jgi:hypothetical protein
VAQPPSHSGAIDGVGVRHIERIFALLRDKLPVVLSANRYFEEQTGFHNEAGTNNIVDAFSHLATLVEGAEELSDAEQAEQVAHLEDHLRRSMMEAFEQVLKYRLGEIAELWEEYLALGQPPVISSADNSHVSIVELEGWRRDIKGLLDRGRETKRGTSWEEWEEGTDFLVQACEASETLMTTLEKAVALARRSDKQRLTYMVAASVAVATFGVGIAVGLGIS